jgi:hypothetical protein
MVKLFYVCIVTVLYYLLFSSANDSFFCPVGFFLGGFKQQSDVQSAESLAVNIIARTRNRPALPPDLFV